MEHEQVINALKKKLRIQQIAFAVIVFIVAASWGCVYLRNTKSIILVDGKPVVCVSSEQEAKELLNQIKCKVEGNPSDIEFRENVVVARAPRDAHPVSRHKAMRLVTGMLSPIVPHWAIIVDGKPIVAVPSKEMAGQVLDMAKLKYGIMVKNLAEVPQFKENVKVDLAAVDPSLYCKTAKQALDVIFTTKTAPVPKDSIYTITKGDTAYGMAVKLGMKLEDLQAINSGIDLERLQIGDKIHIKATAAPKPKLTVVVRDQSDIIETVASPVQTVSSANLFAGEKTIISPGSEGKRQIKMATIYENGKKIGSEIIDEKVIKEAVPKRVAIGIKPRPTWK